MLLIGDAILFPFVPPASTIVLPTHHEKTGIEIRLSIP